MFDVSNRFDAHSRIESRIKIKRRKLGRRLNFIIISEFGNGDPIEPVGLAMINEDVKEQFEVLVDSFHLTIGLGPIQGLNPELR